ncbi:MAG: four helix bundle protein [Phyllobacteriaceae bacterium]|nr:four helix bundle protein [Phyllobacteriaceae bacterium]
MSNDFPVDERFGLTAQVRRSSVSVAANIAEGYGRDSDGDFTRYLRISQGALKETETHLIR